MLDVAQKYTDTLKLKISETAYDLNYMFYHSGWNDEYSPSNENWNQHEFVSLSSDQEILGYIRYSVSRNDYSVHGLTAINFSDDKITFGRDLVQVVDDIFTKYHFRKLGFSVYVGNPIEKTYDKLIEKYGGRIVGIKKEETRLLDGSFYDFKMYEIFQRDYLASKSSRLNKTQPSPGGEQ